MMAKEFPAWFRNAVVYEIYPQSFKDSNGDGIGDFQGIIDKLDYVKSLCVDAIWLNPCFDSPFQDAGYDVRDYTRTAARYGSNEDLKRLFDEAHKRDLRVLLDLVPGHTSIECEWFKRAVSRETTPFDNYYIFTDGWQSDTDNYRFISGYGERDGYYLINFFYSQPALNYGFADPKPQCPWQLPCDHPDMLKVREEIRNVMKFWLDLGCDGFRVDMAFSLVRGTKAAAREKMQELWQDYSSWMKRNYPDAVLVAEGSMPRYARACGFDSDFLLPWSREWGVTRMFRYEKFRYPSNELLPDSPHSFFSLSSSGDSRTLMEELLSLIRDDGKENRFSLISGNHDLMRIRRGRTLEELKVIYAFLFTMPGRPFLYYGDEIGMDYVGSVGNVEGSYERGGSRTPMQWERGSQAGFSSAAPEKFYTMLDPDPARPCVADQEKDAGSLLNFTRKLIALRHEFPALGAEGSLRLLISERAGAPLVYERELAGKRFIVALNPANLERREMVAVPGNMELLCQCGNAGAESRPGATQLILPPVSAAVWRVR